MVEDMLVQNNKQTFNKNDVVGLKLVSGEEIIGRYNGYDSKNKKYSIDKPHTMTVSDAGGGQVGIAFMPFSLIFGIGNIEFPEDSVMLINKADEKIAQSYLQQTTGVNLNP